jgi:hypothetical protein
MRMSDIWQAPSREKMQRIENEMDALRAALAEALDNYANLIEGEFGDAAVTLVPDHLAAIAELRARFLTSPE